MAKTVWTKSFMGQNLLNFARHLILGLLWMVVGEFWMKHTWVTIRLDLTLYIPYRISIPAIKFFENNWKINFQKRSWKIDFRQNVHHAVKFQYFELYFFANILILIVLTDSTIKLFYYVMSCGVNFEKSEIFKGP